MPSKLGIHVNHLTRPDDVMAFILGCRPAAVLSLHHDAGFWREVKSEAPEVLLIGREFFQTQPFDNPESDAANVVSAITANSTVDIYDGWTLYNEVGSHPTHNYMSFQLEAIRLLHDHYGIKVAADSCSVGTWAGSPEDPMSDWYSNWVHEVLRVADWEAVHEYCAPKMQTEFEVYPDDPEIQEAVGGFFTLRFKKWYPVLPGDARPPVLVTECGIDSGAVPHGFEHLLDGLQGGWRPFATPSEYLSQLIWYDTHLRAADYIKGAMIFCCDTLDKGWATFDILEEDMYLLLAEYIRSQHEVPDDDWVQTMRNYLLTIQGTTSDSLLHLDNMPPCTGPNDLDTLLSLAHQTHDWWAINGG